VFLDFVLSQCVIAGLQQEKVSPPLRLKYHAAIADAVRLNRFFRGFGNIGINKWPENGHG
jgi:hypothetical protein